MTHDPDYHRCPGCGEVQNEDVFADDEGFAADYCRDCRVACSICGDYLLAEARMPSGGGAAHIACIADEILTIMYDVVRDPVRLASCFGR